MNWLLRLVHHLFGEPPPPRPDPRSHRHRHGHRHGDHGHEPDVYGLGQGGTEVADDLIGRKGEERPGGDTPPPPHHH